MASLSPESIQQIKRLDLRARMVVRGFLQGLHASPLQGFSVQFADHKRYARGDDPKLIDWLAYAKTDRYFVKRFEAETNMTGYLVMDLSASMSMQTEAMSKFEYSVCLAASLTYLMTMQQDPVGLMSVAESLRAILPAKSRRDHVGNVIASLSNLQPTGRTDLVGSMQQLVAMLRHKSLIMVFSDLLPSGGNEDARPSDDASASATADVTEALCRLGHAGHDVIVFHVLDRSEVEFDFRGAVEFEDSETGGTISVDADAYRDQYRQQLDRYRDDLRAALSSLRMDYVPLDTGMPFDKALTEYLINRRDRL